MLSYQNRPVEEIARNIPALKFFIVDDDPFCRMLYQQHLANLGFNNNHLFENGLDCINQLYQQPDVIFIDYDMRPYNGLDVLKIIRRINPNIYLLVISSRPEAHVTDSAINSGAFGYIVKGEKDLEKINTAINNIATSRELKKKQAV